MNEPIKYGANSLSSADTNNMRYWTSYILKAHEDGKPWAYGSCDACLTLDEAMRNIEKQRRNYIVLSAWIDIFENDEKKTVFHECYLDIMGNVAKPNDC